MSSFFRFVLCILDIKSQISMLPVSITEFYKAKEKPHMNLSYEVFFVQQLPIFAFTIVGVQWL
ncbi:MAG: hypothetical protein ACI32F_01070, partial [Allobaculum sp.]